MIKVNDVLSPLFNFDKVLVILYTFDNKVYIQSNFSQQGSHLSYSTFVKSIFAVVGTAVKNWVVL